MANSYGDWNPTELNSRASGCKHDAAKRAYTKVFDFAADADPAGGTANLLHVGRVREGSVILPEIKIGSTVALAGVNLSVGTLTDDDYFSLAAAGPAANATQTRDILPAVQGLVLDTPVDLYLKPSAAWPAAGRLTVTVEASHR